MPNRIYVFSDMSGIVKCMKCITQSRIRSGVTAVEKIYLLLSLISIVLIYDPRIWPKQKLCRVFLKSFNVNLRQISQNDLTWPHNARTERHCEMTHGLGRLVYGRTKSNYKFIWTPQRDCKSIVKRCKGFLGYRGSSFKCSIPVD